MTDDSVDYVFFGFKSSLVSVRRLVLRIVVRGGVAVPWLASAASCIVGAECVVV